MTTTEAQELKQIIASSLGRYTDTLSFLMDYCEIGSDYRRMKKDGLTRDDLFESLERFLRRVRNDTTWQKDLEAVLNMTEDGIIDRFKDDFSGKYKAGEHMDSLDFLVVPMSFAGFQTKIISFFTGLSCEAVRMRKSRYRRKFRSLGNDNSFDYLRALDS